MSDVAALREAWSHLSGNTVAKLSAINKLTTTGKPVDLPVAPHVARLGDKRALENYAGMIVTQDLRAKLGMPPVSAGVVAANHLLLLLDGHGGSILRTSRPDVLAVFRDLLSTLVADPSSGLTEEDRDNLLALVHPQVPLFPQPIGVLDLAAAKLL
jgi:hypothetical protein